jgi:hypothetical protein
MKTAIRYTALACTFGMMFACTQPGAEYLRPELAAAQPACAPGEKCPPATIPASTAPTSPAVKPAVPPVPDSPIKVNCAKLPTQVERDTCTNRKESTG